MARTTPPPITAEERLHIGFDLSLMNGGQVQLTGLTPTLAMYNEYAAHAAESIIDSDIRNTRFGNRHTEFLDFKEKAKPNPLDRTIVRVTQWNR